VRDRVQAQTVDFEYRFGAAAAAAYQGADARQQFMHVVGFEYVVVGAGIQAGDAICDCVARRHDQHRRGVLAGPQRPQHVEPVAPRQPEVEQHQVVPLAAHGGVGHVSVAHPVDRKVLGPQQVEHHFADHGVIFNQQQTHGQGS